MASLSAKQPPTHPHNYEGHAQAVARRRQRTLIPRAFGV